MNAAIIPRCLRCEYHPAPMAIDAAQPRLSWELAAAAPGQMQAAYQVLVADDPALLAAGQANVWDSGKVDTAQSNQVLYGGPPLGSARRYWWTVRVWDGVGRASAYSLAASWQMGLLDPADWAAQWIGLALMPTHDPVMRPPVYARRAFQVGGRLHRALLFATARGCYQALLNGHPVGDDVLSPGWTDYARRIQYQTYDVTAQVHPGENVVAAVVADGWYAGYVGQNMMRNHYGDTPQLLLQLLLEYTSGETALVVTDAAWKASAGPLRYADLLMGEFYDARLAIPGWAAPGFDDSRWQAVQVQPRDGTPLVAQVDPPVRVMQEVQPAAITQPQPGVYIFDLGQNIVGWARLTAQGTAGQRIQLRHGEMLNPDGTLYTDNLRDARQIDTYILGGGGVESYMPRFTFHGFRYVEVTGLTAAPTANTITGCVVHTALPDAGTFACSHPLVNRLWHNILWGQRGNFLSIPTDCPQRNERLGWTGDAQIFIRTASFNMDVAAFFGKWMDDMVDGQSAAGGFPNFAPRIAMVLDIAPDAVDWDGAPAWGDAGIIIPWTLYRVYGDTRIIARHYAAMSRWMDYIAAANPDGLRVNRCNHNFGDWLALGAETPRPLVATAYWYACARHMQQMAAAIGRHDDARSYAALGDRIRAAFMQAFVAPDGRVSGHTQAGYALALHWGLLPDALRVAAAEHLVAALAANNWHLATGFVGTPLLCPVLAEAGRADVAYRLLLNDTYPSWGYMITQGATTMWERWDGWTAERGFQDPDMNSFNHYAYGAVGEWLYRFVAGIDLDDTRPDHAGYKRIRIRPYPDARLSFARATYRSIYGPISSAWQLEDGQLYLRVSIPANTTARVYVPATEVRQVFGDGLLAAARPGDPAIQGRNTVFEVGSGDYAFAGRWASPPPHAQSY